MLETVTRGGGCEAIWYGIVICERIHGKRSATLMTEQSRREPPSMHKTTKISTRTAGMGQNRALGFFKQ